MSVLRLTDQAEPQLGSLPRAAAGLPRPRRLLGYAVALAGLPALTALLVALNESVTRETVLLTYMLAVLLVSVVGGVGPALLAAVGSFLLANWFLTPPYHTLLVGDREALVDLLVLVVGAVLVSVTVELGARSRAQALRHRLEARLISRLSSVPPGQGSAAQVLEEVRDVLGMQSIALVPEGAQATAVIRVGAAPSGPPSLSIPATDGLRLVGQGQRLFAEDRRLLSSLASTAALAWRREQMAEEARHARELAETDRVRAALLTTVGHDLRTPIAGIKAAVSGLQEDDVALTPLESRDLLDTVERCADQLAGLVDNLLAMSRLQAGAVALHLSPVAVDEVITATLLARGERDVEIDVPDDLPYILADAALLERVFSNVVANARHYSPSGSPVRIRGHAGQSDSTVLHVQVIDHGPGVEPSRWREMFEPFQRLNDSGPGGLGLGLAIARGLTEAMGGRLEPSPTPGGGLTMTLSLRTAP